jgi:hypothetical protein
MSGKTPKNILGEVHFIRNKIQEKNLKLIKD